MRIVTYLNTTPEEVELKTKNIWFGISLGNKYFSKENLEKFIPWLLDHCKEHVLIVIADAIHAINVEVLDHETQIRARKISEKKGLEKEVEIREIVSRLSEADQDKITVVRWSGVEEVEEKRESYKIVKNEFMTNQKFKETILSIVEDHPKVSQKERTAEEYERLADYVLREIPIYINGAFYDGVRYLLQPYPGLGKLDTLIMGLQDGTLFPGLSSKLNIHYKISILEVYAE